MPTNPTDVVNPGFTVNALTPIVLTLDPARGENGEAGPPGQGLNWRGEWQTGVAYNAYDAVSRNGGSYIAEVNNTSVDPATDNGSVWGVMSAPGTPGPAGPAGMHWRGPWNASTSYAINDGVSELGQSYIAISASTGVDPATDGGTHWQLMAASGSGGDMYKATYDVNNDGIVDSAAVAAAVPYAGVTGKPATFPSDWSTTANKPATFPGDWNTTVNKPSSFPASVHGSSHVSTGGDAIPAAGTSAGGLLKPLTGLATDYVGGDNACHSVAAAALPPVADTTQNGLLRQVSGNVTDYVGGDNQCHALSGFITKTAAYTLTIADGNKYVICSGGSWILKLPAPVSGLTYRVRNDMGISGTTGTITLQPNGGTIDSLASASLLPQQECTLITDGANWRTFGLKREVILGTQDITTSTAFGSVLLPAGYRYFELEFDDVAPVTSNDQIFGQLSTDGGNTWLTAASYYVGLIYNTSTTAVTYYDGETVTSLQIIPSIAGAGRGKLILFPGAATRQPSWTFDSGSRNNTAFQVKWNGYGTYSVFVQINAIKYYASTGNIAHSFLTVKGVI